MATLSVDILCSECVNANMLQVLEDVHDASLVFCHSMNRYGPIACDAECTERDCALVQA